MNISPINSALNFRGLWGKTIEEHSGNEYTSLSYVTKSYYPFKDETNDSIQKVIAQNESRYEANWTETGGTYVKEVVSVRTYSPLNITKKEYEMYKASGLGAVRPEELSSPVEKELVGRGLHEYLNKAKKYTEEVSRRNSFSYKLIQFFKNIGRKLKV